VCAVAGARGRETIDRSVVELCATLHQDVIREGFFGRCTLDPTLSGLVVDAHAHGIRETVILALLEAAFVVQRPREIGVDSLPGERLEKFGDIAVWIQTLFIPFGKEVLPRQGEITFELFLQIGIASHVATQVVVGERALRITLLVDAH